jgi:hypothetical protein
MTKKNKLEMGWKCGFTIKNDVLCKQFMLCVYPSTAEWISDVVEETRGWAEKERCTFTKIPLSTLLPGHRRIDVYDGQGCTGAIDAVKAAIQEEIGDDVIFQRHMHKFYVGFNTTRGECRYLVSLNGFVRHGNVNAFFQEMVDLQSTYNYHVYTSTPINENEPVDLEITAESVADYGRFGGVSLAELQVKHHAISDVIAVLRELALKHVPMPVDDSHGLPRIDTWNHSCFTAQSYIFGAQHRPYFGECLNSAVERVNNHYKDLKRPGCKKIIPNLIRNIPEEEMFNEQLTEWLVNTITEHIDEHLKPSYIKSYVHLHHKSGLSLPIVTQFLFIDGIKEERINDLINTVSRRLEKEFYIAEVNSASFNSERITLKIGPECQIETNGRNNAQVATAVMRVLLESLKGCINTFGHMHPVVTIPVDGDWYTFLFPYEVSADSLRELCAHADFQGFKDRYRIKQSSILYVPYFSGDEPFIINPSPGRLYAACRKAVAEHDLDETNIEGG